MGVEIVLLGNGGVGEDHAYDPVVVSLSTTEDMLSADGFARWISPHWAAMTALASRAGATGDDILQDALSAAWRKRRQYNPERGSARNWLLAIVADQRRKHWRKAARGVATELFIDEAVTSGEGDASREGNVAQSVDLERAIAALSRKQRLVVELHYYLGLPIADAAKVLGVSEGTVKSNLSDARHKLKDLLGGDYR